jgi:dihydroorotate dehydrogenase electron transfer subunit
VVCSDRFTAHSRKTFVTTDDGSFGIQGNVSDVAKQLVLKNKYSVIYACGPKPMLKALKELAEKHDIPAQISLEERMACGFGVCLACGVEAPSDNEFGYTYKHICKHGPVFDAREVIL